MSEVERLRNELRKRRAAVSNKINRIKRQTNANVTGSEYDPRRANGIEKRYNKTQLKHHIAELNAFMDRSVQFVGSAGGKPIKRGTWNVLHKANVEAVELGRQHLNNIINRQSPGTDQTIGEVRNMLSGRSSSSIRTPYSTQVLQPSQIEGERAAQMLTGKFRKELSTNFLPTRIRMNRGDMNKAFDTIGEEQLRKDFANISDEAFDILWANPAFIELLFQRYEIAKARLGGSEKEQWQDRVVDEAFNGLQPFLESAIKYDNERQGKEAEKTSRNGRR